MDNTNELELQPKQTCSSTLIADRSSYTQSSIVKCNLKWAIDNFLMLPYKPKLCLQSDVFSLRPKHESEWIIYAYPYGRSQENNKCVELLIKLKSLPPNQSDVDFSCSFFLLGSNLNRARTPQSDRSFRNLSVNGELSCKLDRFKIRQNEQQFTPNGTLTILFELEILSNLTSSSPFNEQIKIPRSTHFVNLSNFLDSTKFSDATLVVGSQEFPVHKIILTARSVVFAAMFEHEFEEQKSNRVPITDIDADVVKEMLHFIYTGESPNVQKMANRLISAADKYLLNGLKLICEKALHLGLSNKNACETFILADRYNAEQLKMKTIDFIMLNAKQIKATAGWGNMRKQFPNLVADLFEAFIEQENKTVTGKKISVIESCATTFYF